MRTCLLYTSFGTSTPDDSKGALLYDTYIIEELRCDSNKGMTLIPAFDMVVSRNKVVVNLGTLTDLSLIHILGFHSKWSKPHHRHQYN